MSRPRRFWPAFWYVSNFADILRSLTESSPVPDAEYSSGWTSPDTIPASPGSSVSYRTFSCMYEESRGPAAETFACICTGWIVPLWPSDVTCSTVWRRGSGNLYW